MLLDLVLGSLGEPCGANGFIRDFRMEPSFKHNQGCFLGTRMQVLSLNSVINWTDTCYVLFVSHAQVCPNLCKNYVKSEFLK